MSEQLSDSARLNTTFIGGRGLGKGKILEDMKALHEQIQKKKKIFKDLEEVFKATNNELYEFGYSFELETGVLAAETYSECGRYVAKTTKFRLVEVKE